MYYVDEFCSSRNWILNLPAARSPHLTKRFNFHSTAVRSSKAKIGKKNSNLVNGKEEEEKKETERLTK